MQVLIVNQAKGFCQAAFSSEGGTPCIICTIYLYYRYAATCTLAHLFNNAAVSCAGVQMSHGITEVPHTFAA